MEEKMPLSYKQKCLLIDQNYDELLRLAENILLNAADSQDVVQKACLLFLLSKTAWSTGWLYFIVFRLACKRRAERDKTISLDDDNVPETKSNSPGPSECLLDKETKELLHKAISMLKDKYRLPIYLYYFQNKSIKESAEILEISVSAFLTRLHRARQYLHDLLFRRMEGMS